MGTIERDCICMLDSTNYIRKQYRREVQLCVDTIKDAQSRDRNLREDFKSWQAFIFEVIAHSEWTEAYDMACMIMMCTKNPNAAYDLWPEVEKWDRLPYHIEFDWDWRILAIAAMHQDIHDLYSKQCTPRDAH